MNTTAADPLTAALGRLESAIGTARGGLRDAARAIASREVSAFPAELNVLHKAGVILAICGDYDASLVLFKRALELHPRFHFTEIEMGSTYAALGQKAEALKWYRQAIESCPEYPIAYILAAKLERELGHSWNGLVLLNQLCERLPGCVEGNVLRAEFLQYHGNRPEAVRAYKAAISAGCDDPMPHFHYMRLLTELGDYRELLAYAGTPNRPGGAFLEFHTAVFTGHARLALAVDYSLTVANATERERSPAWLDTEQLATRLQAAIRSRTPLSMIRIGDGEGRFLALSAPWVKGLISPREAGSIVSLIWQNWFGKPIDTANTADLESLSAMFTDALMGADILGVTTVERYERDMYHRGYHGALEHKIAEIVMAHPAVLLTDAMVHVSLHRRSPFYRELLSGLDFVGCISPHPGLAARLARYHGIPTFHEYLVPGESRLPEAAQGRGAGSHFPDRFHDIMSHVRVPRRGAVFLVAAGLLGKVYCHRIRQLGGIAIDIGSIVDAWMGFDTRPGQYKEPSRWILPGESGVQ